MIWSHLLNVIQQTSNIELNSYKMIVDLFGLNSTPSVYYILPLLILLVLLKCLAKLYQRDPRLVQFAETIPGPAEIPLFGSFADFYFAEDIIKKLTEYFHKYGHIYKLWFGKHLVIGLSRAEDLNTVFMSSKLLGKPDLFRPFHDYWGDGLFTSPLAIWKHNRKKLTPAFTSNRFEQYTIDINNKTNNVVKIMEKHVDGPEFEIRDYTPYLSFDIITKLLFNVELGWADQFAKDFHNSLMKAIQISSERMVLPWFHTKFFSDLYYGKQSKEIITNTRKLTKKIIHDKIDQIKTEIALHKENSTKASVNDVPSKLFLTYAYELLDHGYDISVVNDEIVNGIGGGTETTATVLSFFFLAVAIHQNVQAKIYNELYEIFGDSDRDADQDDIKRLQYFDQVLKETMRMFPLIPFVLRHVQEDTKIGDRVFPAGTEVMISIAAVHFNPEYYPNPKKFNPENFNVEVVKNRPKHAFIPFSAGARNCIGQNLALLEMKLIATAFLRKYSFHTTMTMDDIKLNRTFTVFSVNGYKMSIKHRIKKPHQ